MYVCMVALVVWIFVTRWDQESLVKDDVTFISYELSSFNFKESSEI